MTKLTYLVLLPCLTIIILSGCGLSSQNSGSSIEQQVRQALIDKNDAGLDGNFTKYCQAYTVESRKEMVGYQSVADCANQIKTVEQSIKKSSPTTWEAGERYWKWENSVLPDLVVKINGSQAVVRMPKPSGDQYKLMGELTSSYTLVKASGEIPWLISKQD